MSPTDTVFFIYAFLALYMSSLFAFIYIPNRKRMFEYPRFKHEPVSIVIPCYNEAKHIGDTIESLLNLDWPKKMIEIIVVDDKSKDDSVKIARKYARKYKNVRVIVNKRNSGGAAEPCNIGIDAAKYDYVAITDADSRPAPNVLNKMMGFLQKERKTAAVTCSVLVDKPPKKFIQKLQQVEYIAIAFSRKLLDFVNAVYVTPGPFALYKKKILEKVGKFDVSNLTQDIEIVWALKRAGYDSRMSLDARVYTSSPSKWKVWWKQRLRWNIGGIQTILKYKQEFLRKNMLGSFILPFFSISLFIGVLGLAILLNRFINRLAVLAISTKYSLYANTIAYNTAGFTFSTSVINFFFIALFALGLFFTFFGLTVLAEFKITVRDMLNVLFYFAVYLSIYPFLLVASIVKFARGNYSW